MNKESIQKYCNQRWNESVLPELIEYIRIPNKSPMFDPEWEAHGYMEKVVTQFKQWCLAQEIPGMQLEVVRLPGRTPLLFMEIPGETEDTILLYGHLDKQPEMNGWREGLGPWLPVLEGDKLYGRGGADDGYATFASLIAIKALQAQQIPHARCVVIIEACEESGSFDLPYYIDALAERIGKPELVICLDSGCGNYDQLWCTTSLRGLIGGDLKIKILEEGVHSGDASGVVPSSFRILRKILDRIEESNSGVVSANEFNVDIPKQRIQQAELAAEVLQEDVYAKFPFVGDAQPTTSDSVELVLNRTWRPALAITGADGLPPIDSAGNVLRPSTSVKISLRLPPTCDAKVATVKLKALLESDPPYGAKVTFKPDWDASGWHAPPMVDWLEQAIDQASLNYFGAPAVHMGEGGSIPFMGMLGEKFPEAQFLITGVLGPHSNAHGPNEFLHIPTAKKLTCCVAEVIAKHFQQFSL
ncbi:MAG: acetylornithine deacetylase/succinyl-diaminopimelate desuccinylase-like protein [Gammaproteobacteria bacterium]|jgi:acetylornithine deacetylase/succinyl-diaminopimelate desuccinylase-like protein